jgi:GGDEF domain-containing protein
LLDGISRYAYPYDREEYEEFRRRFQQLAGALAIAERTDTPADIAGDALAAMADYNRDAQRVVGGQAVELRCMIEMLSQTLLSLAEAGGQSALTLQTLRHQVEAASRLDDIRAVRARLGDSLKILSDETRRQRERSAQMREDAVDAARLAAGHHSGSGIDSVTGIEPRQSAETEIADRLQPESFEPCSPGYAAVLVVERVDAINLRYGFPAGDKLLRTFAQQIAAKIPPPDALFRWRGPAFVMLLGRTAPPDAVRAEVGRLAGEQLIEVNGSPLPIPVTCTWTVLALEKRGSAADVYQKIDRFVAEHGGALVKN